MKQKRPAAKPGAQKATKTGHSKAPGGKGPIAIERPIEDGDFNAQTT